MNPRYVENNVASVSAIEIAPVTSQWWNKLNRIGVNQKICFSWGLKDLFSISAVSYRNVAHFFASWPLGRSWQALRQTKTLRYVTKRLVRKTGLKAGFSVVKFFAWSDILYCHIWKKLILAKLFNMWDDVQWNQICSNNHHHQTTLSDMVIKRC